MGTSLRTLTVAATALTMSTALAAQDVSGGRVVPTNEFVVTGYGTVGYAYQTQGEKANEFTTSFNPIFLFQFQDRVLFEAEFEFELEEGVTQTGLEYAQVDVILHDNLTLVGGKFLVPFGVFGERLHPTWINRFPTSPPLYGHHGSQFGAEPMFPILADVGLMARGVITPGPWSIALNAYVTQGPAAEDPDEPVPELEFPASSGDNNTDKLFGARLDIALPPWAELNLSYIQGDYDENNVLALQGVNVAAEARAMGLEVRGEYLLRRQEIETLAGFPTVRRDGFYAQASYRSGPWEPVARWTQVFDTKQDGAVMEEGAWQMAFGLDYWFNPSIAVMAGYELNREKGTEVDNDRLVIHVAYGF